MTELMILERFYFDETLRFAEIGRLERDIAMGSGSVDSRHRLARCLRANLARNI
jgi:hypothetical protein